MFNLKLIHLKPEDINFYREWSIGKKLPLFFEPWWLDAVCGENHWKVVLSKDGKGEINGICPVYKSSLKGLPVLRNPDFSPYSGVFLVYPADLASEQSKYSFENKTSAVLLDQLPRDAGMIQMNLHPTMENAYPFIWKRYHQTTRYTYRLEDISDQESISKGMSQTLRRQIRQARETHKISLTEDPDIIYNLLSKSLNKQQVRHRISKEMIFRISSALYENNQGKLLIASNMKQEIVASMILAMDHDTAYCLALGMDHELEQTHASKLLIAESVRLASSHVKRYDFEGSMIPNVERIYRSFGGTRVAYHQLMWFKNRWIKALWYFLK